MMKKIRAVGIDYDYFHVACFHLSSVEMKGSEQFILRMLYRFK